MPESARRVSPSFPSKATWISPHLLKRRTSSAAAATGSGAPTGTLSRAYPSGVVWTAPAGTTREPWWNRIPAGATAVMPRLRSW